MEPAAKVEDVAEPEHDEVDAAVIAALDTGDTAGLKELVDGLHYADVADIVERLNPDRREQLLTEIGPDMAPDVLAELDETVREEIFEAMAPEQIAAHVQELDSDDAVEIVNQMEAPEQQKVLEAMPAPDRRLIEQSLSYPEESAGRLMQREIVTVPTHWTVGQTIDFMRQAAEGDDDILPGSFYDIFVVDPMHKPVGTIHLSHLLRAKRPVKVTDIMETELKLISVTMDQEDVAFLFRQRDLVSAPVVDEAQRLVGAITIDDVVDVIHEEHEEDMLALAGVGEDDLYDAAIDTTKARFRWLLVNLFTAILASLVIGLFATTLEQIVALAILMPIVASMGGNAGTQTLTVAVRAMAMRELTSTNAYRVIGKEVLVGAINGVLFAVITGAIAWFWFDAPQIGLIIGLAMIINMVIAGLAGAAIPLVLDRFGVDPAIASSVFLTTVTDVVGFFAFLGLAALFLL
ncbi:MAG: magnesium transporter [Rhodospirillaceae bacterium]|nr:magnesium transporter [Rhodospirillaceae bacterium]